MCYKFEGQRPKMEHYEQRKDNATVFVVYNYRFNQYK